MRESIVGEWVGEVLPDAVARKVHLSCAAVNHKITWNGGTHRVSNIPTDQLFPRVKVRTTQLLQVITQKPELVSIEVVAGLLDY